MGVIGLYLYLEPASPRVDSLRDLQLQTPMTIYSSDGHLISEFGDKRRIPLKLEEVPQTFIHALIATEDQRFYEHFGIDFIGIIRAVVNLVTTGTRSQGASTITQLVARNVFLNRQKTFTRKFREIFLALKIEQELSKDEILELFVNKVHFSHRAYGLGAAAQVYYGESIEQLTLPQLAVLAGIPKGESLYNPISNPKRALERRNHVLSRMLAEKFIDQTTFEEAKQTPITAKKHAAQITLEAPYFAEMIRQQVIGKYGEQVAYNSGLKITTTLKSDLQRVAQDALQTNLLDYESRHGYRGPEQRLEDFHQLTPSDWQSYLKSFPKINQLTVALVTHVDEQKAALFMQEGTQTTLEWEGMEWARPYIDENQRGPKPEKAADILTPGDVIRVFQQDNQLKLAQIPEVDAGFVALNPQNGEIIALVGGYDFSVNQFNMVTQASRSPGSNIKPFIYSAALEKGFTPASVLNDAPFVKEDAKGENWRPKNSSGRYRGPTRLRVALSISSNSISARLLEEISPQYAVNYLSNIGFPKKGMQANNSLALGSANFSPLEIATGYSVFANGGYQVEPYSIERIESADEDVLYQAEPMTVCIECQQPKEHSHSELLASKTLDSNLFSGILDLDAPLSAVPLFPIAENKVAPQVIESRNAFIMTSMMKDVIHKGTAWRTLQRTGSPLLKRNDIAGKTGTTNDSVDAWFSGFNGHFAATAWVGFEDNRSLGKNEFGSKAALPIWQKFMEFALKDTHEKTLSQPSGIVTARIDKNTGLLAHANTHEALFEFFREEFLPKAPPEAETQNIETDDPEDIFN